MLMAPVMKAVIIQAIAPSIHIEKVKHFTHTGTNIKIKNIHTQKVIPTVKIDTNVQPVRVYARRGFDSSQITSRNDLNNASNSNAVYRGVVGRAV